MSDGVVNRFKSRLSEK